MVVLKKVRAATLVETLIASVLIVIVFMIASASINNVFKQTIKTNDHAYQSRIKELCYFAIHNELDFPFSEDNLKWKIEIEKIEDKILIDGLNKSNGVSHNTIVNEN